MALSERVFHLFPQLPAELRDEIWRYCLPNRIWERDEPEASLVYVFEIDEENDPTPCSLWHTTVVNGCPPVISRVCRESRSVAFETGSEPAVFDEEPPEDSRWSCSIDAAYWLDRTRDSVHMNWTPIYEVEYSGYGSPLHCLAWQAAQLPGRGSLMMHYLDPQFGGPRMYDGPEPDDMDVTAPPIATQLNPTQTRDLDALGRRSSWLVIFKIIVVHYHIKPAAATGLFGLLGDARVQVVDVSEEARVSAYFDLAETCERKGSPLTTGQNLHRDSADTMREQLRDLVMLEFGSEALAAAMRPAFMFRLCTQMCNHCVAG
ncbi:hypothetical protein LTR85_011814 [Meristemomyces frigidus]|nr:hypothetical protein LTR85_011814 [Meristemomyces frigidus]